MGLFKQLGSNLVLLYFVFYNHNYSQTLMDISQFGSLSSVLEQI